MPRTTNWTSYLPSHWKESLAAARSEGAVAKFDMSLVRLTVSFHVFRISQNLAYFMNTQIAPY